MLFTTHTGMALPVAQVALQRCQEQELRRALREIRNAIDAYKRASDEGRIPRPAGSSGYPNPVRMNNLIEYVQSSTGSCFETRIHSRRLSVSSASSFLVWKLARRVMIPRQVPRLALRGGGPE
jgi:type II secretory pathway pseudopilin PulG